MIDFVGENREKAPRDVVTITRYPMMLVRFGRKLYDQDRCLIKDEEAVLKAFEAKQVALFTEPERPRPLETYIERPDFPTEALPAPFAGYIKALAESVQVPEDMVGAAVLAVLSGCVHGCYAIGIKDKYVEPLNLYVQVVANPGERKSPIFAEVAKPIKAIQQKLVEQFKEQDEDAAIDLTYARRKLKKLENDYERVFDTDDAKDVREQIKATRRKITDLEKRRTPTIFMDNATTEAMTVEVARNGGRMMVMSDEGDLINILSGVYANGQKMIDLMLKGHTGGSVRIDRKGHAPIVIPTANLTVLLMVQPYIIAKIMRDTELRGWGLNARFLYTMPLTRVGERDTRNAAPMDQVLDVNYYNAVYDLFLNHLELPKTPKLLSLSPQALERFYDYEAAFEHRLKVDLQKLTDWGNKLGGAMARMAGILHVVKHPKDAVAIPIEASTMDEAHALAQYFCEYARIVFNMGAEDGEIARALTLIKRIKELEMDQFTRRTIHRKAASGFNSAEDMQASLNILEDYGYLKGQTCGSGKRRTRVYQVNPLVFSERAIWSAAEQQQPMEG